MGFVAVHGGGVAKSTDGVNYTAPTTPPTSGPTWFDVIYADGKFVAIGPNGCAYSTDGDNWVDSPIGTGQWRGIAFNGAIWIATGDVSSGNPNYATSTDLTSWSYPTSPNAAQSLRFIMTVGTMFVINRFGAGSVPTLRSTDDGATWAPAAGVAANGAVRVRNANGLLFSVESAIQVSTNSGDTWVTSATGAAFGPRDLTYGAGLYVSCGTGSGLGIRTSPTGLTGTWTVRTITTSSWQSVAWDPVLGLFSCVSQSSSGLASTSSDGVTWTTPASMGVSGSWVAVCAGPFSTPTIRRGYRGIGLVRGSRG